MAEIQDLQIVDGNNVGRWPENMAFSAVNDAGRADEGMLARWYQDTNASILAGGSTNLFTITSNRAITTMPNNLVMAFTSNQSINGPSALNLNGLGYKSILRYNGAVLASGDIIVNQPIVVIYKSSPDCWFMISAPAALTGNTFADFAENASPGTPAADTARLAAFDDTGVTRLKYIDGSGNVTVLYGYPAATAAEMEAASALNRVSTPGLQQRHPGHPKAWGYVISAALQANYGVSSITNPSAGKFTVTLATAMSSSNYCVMTTLQSTGSVPTQAQTVRADITSASTFDLYTVDANNGLLNRNFSFAVFGDQ